MKMLNPELAGPAAASLVKDQNVGAAMAVTSDEATRLALALVADADIAADLAAELLERHASNVDALEHRVMNVTARRDHEGGKPIVTYELDPTTRNCLRLISALKLIAAEGMRRSAA